MILIASTCHHKFPSASTRRASGQCPFRSMPPSTIKASIMPLFHNSCLQAPCSNKSAEPLRLLWSRAETHMWFELLHCFLYSFYPYCTVICWKKCHSLNWDIERINLTRPWCLEWEMATKFTRRSGIIVRRQPFFNSFNIEYYLRSNFPYNFEWIN